MHDFFMAEALKEARRAFVKDEVPVGAVIVKEGKIIARAHNLIKSKHNSTGHAEIIAIQKACKKLKNERLLGCDIYVNIEPCAMCAGALVLARVKRIIYGAADPKTGACGSVYDIASSGKNNHNIEVINGIMEKESAEILRSFFRNKRKK
jgi:tRNA(adenine34) deaminase